MVNDGRKFDRTKLTELIIQGLKDSLMMMEIHRVKADHPNRLEVENLLSRLTKEALDVRLVTRDY